MTNEERQLIEAFIKRVGGAPGGFGGSVPATTPALPPIDPAADAVIAEQFARYPEARYRITQMAFVQEHALAEAQNQINRLQWELQNVKQQQVAPQPAASPWGAAAQPQQPSRGLFGGLFGGGAQPQQPQYQQPAYQQPQYAPPPPQYAPGYQPGMFQRPGGSGFLGSALTTAAGVAGGMVAGNALMNLFSGSHGGGGFASAAPVEYVPAAPASSPWAAPTSGPAVDPYDVGGAPKDPTGWSGQDQGWQTPTAAPGGWEDAPAADDTTDSGWTDSSGGDFDNS